MQTGYLFLTSRGAAGSWPSFLLLIVYSYYPMPHAALSASDICTLPLVLLPQLGVLRLNARLRFQLPCISNIPLVRLFFQS